MFSQIALDINCGLCYLHSQNVVHLDLKADNIFMSEAGHAKIGANTDTVYFGHVEYYASTALSGSVRVFF